MQGNDFIAAATPNWIDQAEDQMSDLFSTLEEINDPTCFDLWEQLDDAIRRAKARNSNQ